MNEEYSLHILFVLFCFNQSVIYNCMIGRNVDVLVEFILQGLFSRSIFIPVHLH